MTQEISSLMDGELEDEESGRAIRACCADKEAARKWNEYHLIGEALRGHSPRPSRIALRVSEALAKEPTVLAPRARGSASITRIALAAAASVATVGVVAWMGLQQGATPSPGATMARAPAQAGLPAVAAARSPQAPSADVQDYLVAHRQIPSTEYYRPVAVHGR